MLNDFAVRPPTIALTWCASDSCCSSRPWNAFVVSMTGFPPSPVTVPRASAIEPDGTATTTTSAPEASPPSRPSASTSCPAACQRFASPPPTFPLPTTVIFMALLMGSCSHIGSQHAKACSVCHGCPADRVLLRSRGVSRRQNHGGGRLARHAGDPPVHDQDHVRHIGAEAQLLRRERDAGGHAQAGEPQVHLRRAPQRKALPVVHGRQDPQPQGLPEGLADRQRHGA